MKNVKKVVFSFVLLLVAFVSLFSITKSDNVYAESYRVTFDYNYASLSPKLPSIIRDTFRYNKNVSYNSGDLVECPVDTTSIEPYYNLEWQLIDGDSVDIVDIDTLYVTKPITLRAKWTPKTYHIYYVFDESEKDLIKNLKTSEPYNFESPQINFYRPEKDNYMFADWYKDINRTELYINLPSGSIGDVYVYPKWLPKTYTITYHTDVNNIENELTYTYNTPDFVLQSPVKTGYTFGGWYLDKELTKECKVITSGMSGNIDLYAKWIPNELKVTYVMPDGTHQVVICNYGEKADLPKIEKGFFEIIKTSVPRDNITEDTTILIKKVNIWYVYFLGLLVILGAGITVLVVILVRRKKLRRLRIMYQSNYKKL